MNRNGEGKATAIVTAPRAAVRRWRTGMALMGLGLGTSTIGLGWDFYVHEIAREAAEVESIFAPPHIPIFIGFLITGLGFLWSLARIRLSHALPSA